MDVFEDRHIKKPVFQEYCKINRMEKNSLMYYQGGGENIKLLSTDQNLRKFYDINNSYIVLNALLMPGINNERARLKYEKKRVDISAMLECIDELLKVYCHLYSAMCKYTYCYEHEKQYYTYRCDRMNTLEFLENGQMYSFMSTEKYKSGNTDFHDKEGILLLEIRAPGNIEHIDINSVLGEESKYPHEHEILFAPYILLHKEPLEMTETERDYRDINQEPPKGKYLLFLETSSIISSQIQERKRGADGIYEKIADPVSINNTKYIWKCFMEGYEPETDAVELYTRWKENLQIYLKWQFTEIKDNIMNNMENCQENLVILQEDIIQDYNNANIKRKKYKICVNAANVGASISSLLATLFLALSFIESLQDLMKVISMICTTISAAFLSIPKVLAWNEKLQQRTETYLKLDELLTDLKYEKKVNEDIFNTYLKRYKEIYREDNRKGLESARKAADSLKDMRKEPEKI